MRPNDDANRRTDRAPSRRPRIVIRRVGEAHEYGLVLHIGGRRPHVRPRQEPRRTGERGVGRIGNGKHGEGLRRRRAAADRHLQRSGDGRHGGDDEEPVRIGLDNQGALRADIDGVAVADR